MHFVDANVLDGREPFVVEIKKHHVVESLRIVLCRFEESPVSKLQLDIF